MEAGGCWMMELMMSPWLPTKSSLASIPDHSMKFQQDRYLFPCLIFYNINQDHIGSSFVFRYTSSNQFVSFTCRRSGVLDRPNPLARAVRSRCHLPVRAEWLSFVENTHDHRGRSVQHYKDPGSHRGMHAGPWHGTSYQGRKPKEKISSCHLICFLFSK